MIKSEKNEVKLDNFYGRIKDIRNTGDSAYLRIVDSGTNTKYPVTILHLTNSCVKFEGDTFTLTCDANIMITSTPVENWRRIALEILCNFPFNPECPLDPIKAIGSKVFVEFKKVTL